MSNYQAYDPWEAAGLEPVNTREYYGQIDVDCVAKVFPGEKGSGLKPEVYDPVRHAGKRPFTEIAIRLNPLAEMQLANETKKTWQNYSSDWLKITMPSIKRLGFTLPNGGADLKKFDKQYVKFQFVEGFSKNKDPEKPNYKTMEFLEVYKDKAECLKAYLAENGDANNAETPAAQPQSTSDPAVKSALVFVRSIAENAMKIGDDVPEAVDKFLTQNVAACAGLKIDSPEIQALLKEFAEDIPF